jgi:hypothetical protein
MKTTLGTAVAGLVLGGALMPLGMFTFSPFGLPVFAALTALAALRNESRGLAGGILVAFGLWWVYFVRQAVERCALLDLQPNGSCSIYGTEGHLALAGTVMLLGVLLVAIALRNDRARA